MKIKIVLLAALFVFATQVEKVRAQALQPMAQPVQTYTGSVDTSSTQTPESAQISPNGIKIFRLDGTPEKTEKAINQWFAKNKNKAAIGKPDIFKDKNGALLIIYHLIDVVQVQETEKSDSTDN